MKRSKKSSAVSQVSSGSADCWRDGVTMAGSGCDAASAGGGRGRQSDRRDASRDDSRGMDSLSWAAGCHQNWFCVRGGGCSGAATIGGDEASASM